MKSIPKRRRIEAKTDYVARLSLLKSSKPRFVVRRTNRYMIAQLVSSKNAQDSVLLSVSSKDLLDKSWPSDKAGSLKGLPAAYLTGILFGNLAKKISKEAILDLGMHRNVKKSRIYAVLKGAVDAGLVVAHSGESLPSEKDITSKSCGSLVASLKGKL